MDGLSLYQTLTALTRELDERVGELEAVGRRRAECERDYRVALAKRMLKLRDDGKPATLVPDLARGDAEVSLLRLERDCSDVAYRAALEAINACKLQIRIADAQATREWSNQ